MSILDKYIDQCETFSEIAEWRAEYYKTEKKSGNDYTGILTNIYKEPTHFIYELLQNADDAKATNVKFVLSRDKIEFFHDGLKEFSLSDIISITGVGNSSKDVQDTTSIGKFGVGFKAVFAVTDKPLIYSTTYNFQIENLSVPSEISGRDLEDFTTIFQLDFKHEGQATLFHRNEALLRSMSPETILFLKNICNVEISIDDESLQEISIRRSEVDHFFSRIKYHTNEQSYELLKFTRQGCSLVYQLIDGRVEPLMGLKISVFFPTIIDSNLPFMVDAPFQTSTTRESIDFELQHNKQLVEGFGSLFSESLDKLRSLNLFNVRVFNDIMPIRRIEDSEDFPIYKTLRSTFLEKIKSSAFVPASSGTLVRAAQVSVAEDPKVSRLLRSVPELNFAHHELSDAAILFIQVAGAKIFEPVQILILVNNNKLLLNNQTDEWLYSFYEYCLRSIQNDGWSNLFTRTIKTTPVIKTRAGGFTAAFLNHNPNIFRPSRGIPDHRTIHPMFLTEAASVSDETKGRMKHLLSDLGITERKPVIVIKEDYFRDYSDKTYDEKIEAFQAAADIYLQSEPKDKPDIIAYLKNVAFVPSKTNEFKLATALYDSYNPDLSFLLGANHPELFCSDLVSGSASNREFGLALGMIDHLKVDEIVTHQSSREGLLALYELAQSSLDYGTSTKDFIRRNYESQSITAIVTNVLSAEITSRLAPLLLKITPDQLKETFEWSYHGTKKEVIGVSALCKVLTDAAWIARDDQMVKTVDISFDDFCDLYKLPRDNVLQNLTWSNDDIIKQLSEKEQEAIRLMRELDLSPEEMHELRRATLEKRQNTERLEKRVSTTIEERHDYEEQPVASDTEPVDVQDEAQSFEAESSSLNASETYEAAETHRNQTVTTRVAGESNHSNVELEEREVLKGLVDWYEGDGYTTEQQDEDRAVYTLQKDDKTLQVMLMPKNQSGYNIEISENDKIVKTVAVIKTDLDKKRFAISESQWDLSKRGDIQHSIYLVSRHGGSMSQIVIDDLRERIKNGSVRAVPGVVYY